MSPAESAVRDLLGSLDDHVEVRRPRGLWIVEAIHWHGGGGLLAEARRARGAAGRVAQPSPSSTEATATAPAPTESALIEAAPTEALADARARLLDEGAGLLDVAVEFERGLAQLAGARVRALAGFARCRPVSWDRQPGERGAASAASRAARPVALTAVSEWAVDEVAARLRLPGSTAAGLLAVAVELVEQLPGTLAALEAGDISWAQAQALTELLGPVSEAKKAAVEARVLPRAPRQTVAQLRECTRRAIARIDAAAAVRRLQRAIRGRKVTRQAGEDGMAVLTAWLPAPVARACWEALRAYAQACAVDAVGRPDPRSLDERMADCLADLILRPDAAGRSPVRVLLTLIASVGTLTGTGPDADEPGELDGDTVPAALVRELAHTLGLLPRPAGQTPRDHPPTDPTDPTDPAESQPAGAAPTDAARMAGSEAATRDDVGADDPTAEGAVAADGDGFEDGDVDGVRAASEQAGRPTGEGSEATTGEAETGEGATGEVEGSEVEGGAAGQSDGVAAARSLAALLDVRRLAGTALAERPRIAAVDPLTGCLLALTDSTQIRAAVRDGLGLGPPPETDGYRPSAPLDRFVRLRDRRCRFPGCRARARRGDLDHRVPYPLGPTAHHNLEGLCEHHHRLSHQAPGWHLSGTTDDGLVWTLPGGTTITTVPPRFGTDDGNQPLSTVDTERCPDTDLDWRRLTPDQRREQMRLRICGRPARPGEEPAPF